MRLEQQSPAMQMIKMYSCNAPAQRYSRLKGSVVGSLASFVAGALQALDTPLMLICTF